MMLINAHKSNYSKGRGGQDIKYIVLHYTANNGDTARGNCLYFQGANRKASAHYFIDEDEVLQSILDKDTAWSVGKQYGKGGRLKGIVTNQNSLNLEMCSDIINGKYVITDKTVERTRNKVLELMDKYNVPITNVIRHFDGCNKICPEPWVRNERLWITFKESLEGDKMEKISEWAKEAQKYVIKSAISDGTRPKDIATREEIWTMFYNMSKEG